MKILDSLAQQLATVSDQVASFVLDRVQAGQIVDSLAGREFPSIGSLGIRIDPIQAIASARYGILLPMTCAFVGYRVRVLENGAVSTTVISPATHSALMTNFEGQERRHGRVTRLPDLSSLA